MEEKLTLFGRIKKIFSFRLKLESKKAKSDRASEGGEATEGAQASEGQEGGSEKVKKPKNEKKAKEKKPKKPKEKKVKEPMSGKKKAIIFLVGGVVALGSGAAAALLVLGHLEESRPGPEELLEMAAAYVEQEEFISAFEIYAGIIGSERNLDLIADAYLGIADAHIAEYDISSAIVQLQIGYRHTGDERISEMLEELTAVPEGETAVPLITDLPIIWVDPAFENMLRLAMDIESGPISRRDLEGVRSLRIFGNTHAVAGGSGTPGGMLQTINTPEGYIIGDVLFTERGNITSLADIANLPNLARLTVAYNSITDISAVAGLSNLTHLGLYGNQIADITPIGNLSNLQGLFIYANNISDLSPLGYLPSLRELFIQHNNISDISPLATIPNLTELFVGNNSIYDISAVSQMDSLLAFYARDNNISYIGPVAYSESLAHVSFVGNPVTDLSPAAGIPNVNRPYRGT